MFTSDRLQYEGLVQIKVYSEKDGLSSQSSSTSSFKEGPLLGELEVKKRIQINKLSSFYILHVSDTLLFLYKRLKSI